MTAQHTASKAITPIIKATALAYVRVQVEDLEASERFFNKFGLITRERTVDRLYLAGTGSEHHLVIAHAGSPKMLAAAFEVANMRDLERASAMIAGASGVLPLSDAGGGFHVTLPDADGNMIELVHGITECAPVAVLDPPELNTAIHPNRRRNQIVRPAFSPSRVARLGHVVFKTPSIETLVQWYAETIGFLDSDDVAHEKGEELIMSFVRLDRGHHYVDHHVMQFLKGERNHINHISFEVQDLDDLYMGHDALADAGYRHVWGIGRHLQGSQIFDYWLDPHGVMYEHWTDSDRFDASVPKGFTRLHDMDGPWGPPMPDAFIQQKSV